MFDWLFRPLAAWEIFLLFGIGLVYVSGGFKKVHHRVDVAFKAIKRLDTRGPDPSLWDD